MPKLLLTQLSWSVWQTRKSNSVKTEKARSNWQSAKSKGKRSRAMRILMLVAIALCVSILMTSNSQKFGPKILINKTQARTIDLEKLETSAIKNGGAEKRVSNDCPDGLFLKHCTLSKTVSDFGTQKRPEKRHGANRGADTRNSATNFGRIRGEPVSSTCRNFLLK